MTRLLRRVLAPSLLMFALLAPPAAAAPALTPGTGASAPRLVLKGLDGAAYDLAAYRGKVVLINFWATWCEPCRQEMPSIERLSHKLAGKPFVVLAVNLDEPEARIRQYLRQTPLELPILLDPNKAVAREWGVRMLPATFIIDRDGRIRYRLIGDLDWSSETVLGVIAQLISGG